MILAVGHVTLAVVFCAVLVWVFCFWEDSL